MKKEVIIRAFDNGSFKLPRFIRLFDSKNKTYKVLYKGKEYKKESNIKEIRQITQVIEALNIKDKKKRLKFIYNKACDILDDDFYGKNVCGFKNNKCLKDRTKNNKCDGCCRCSDNNKHCKYLINHICSTRCLACKFYICSIIKNKGYKYKVNDILVLKYLLNWKQKIMIYSDFFMTVDEVVYDLYKNNIVKWAFRRYKEKFIYDGK